MSTFASLLRRADTLRRLESNPIREAWWVGYMRGLRRAHHGENFGTQAEHEMWLSLGEITGGMTSKHSTNLGALGNGYRAGLTLEMRDPPDDAGARMTDAS